MQPKETFQNPTTEENDLAMMWKKAIVAAEEYHTKWSQKMKCDTMEEYYEGRQWKGEMGTYEPYVLNLIYSTLEIKLPSLLFDIPQFHIKPRPRRGSYDLDSAIKRSLLREDMLNTIISDPEIDFAGNAARCIKDAFFRFGIVEVGYSANWIENPNADKPILHSDETPMVDLDNNVIKQPAKLPQTERIYIKRIPAKRFRVGGVEGATLEQSNWYGYYSWYRPEDLRANKNLKNVDKIEWSGGRTPDFYPDANHKELQKMESSGDVCLVWTIFDNRKKRKVMFHHAQGLILLDTKFERCAHFDLRFSELFEGFYPFPPVRAWKDPQDELNEAKEQLKNHRRRFLRKYVYAGDAFEEEEIDKLMNGGDGTWARAKGNDIEKSIMPVPNADLGSSNREALTIDKDDFNIASGTSEEQRGQSDRTTATQANIINQKAQVRDSSARIQVAKWLSRIGREVLLLAEEKYTLPIWVKMLAEPGAAGENASELTEVWHQISLNDLKQKNGEDFEDDLDFDTTISIDSLSPITNDEEKAKFLEFLAVINQYPELSSDPLLIREAAYRVGYRNEKVIVRMQQAAQMMLVNKMQAQAPQGGGSQMGQAVVAQQTPNTMPQIQNQIKNQVSGVR